MKLLKRITAVMAALLIVVNITVVNIFAVGAAPVVAGEELAALLTELLLAAGHSQSELDGLGVTELQSLANSEFGNGSVEYDFSIPIDNTKLGYRIIANAINDFASDWVDGYEYIFQQTSTTDLMDCGAKIVITYKSGSTRIIVGSYATLSAPDSWGRRNIVVYGEGFQYDLQKDGTYKETMHFIPDAYWHAGNPVFSDDGNVDFSGTVYKLYGDIRTLDGESFPTDDEYEYQLGDIDGTAITPDMLNPDGTVTIDGVTYDPADYLDPDKLTEEGKQQLINNILNVINNTYVISEDKPLVDEDDITVEVAEELENFTVPTGIISVFPFCLPFDFVRGMKTLVQKPKVPVFKTELDLTNFCGYDLGKHTIEISFEKWEPAVNIFRWFSILMFIYVLILITPKICKGAG